MVSEHEDQSTGARDVSSRNSTAKQQSSRLHLPPFPDTWVCVRKLTGHWTAIKSGSFDEACNPGSHKVQLFHLGRVKIAQLTATWINTERRTREEILLEVQHAFREGRLCPKRVIGILTVFTDKRGITFKNTSGHYRFRNNILWSQQNSCMVHFSGKVYTRYLM